MGSERLESDLDFVRRSVERSEALGTPASIHFLWAAIVLVGFTLVDVAPGAVNGFWAVAGPLGWVVSAWLGFRFARRSGQMDRGVGMRYALHWMGVVVAMFLLALLGLRGLVDWPALGPAFLLLIALAYFLAGVHLDRRLLWFGPLAAAAYVAVLFLPGMTWTFVGVLWSAGLVATAILGRSPRVAPAG